MYVSAGVWEDNMNYSIIALSSVTAAKRVERLALENGIFCQTLHTPKIISKNGCSHSVRVKRHLTGDILGICSKLGIQVKGVYAERTVAKGRVEYEKID